jgi:membrane-associated phospholipid phosphatase
VNIHPDRPAPGQALLRLVNGTVASGARRGLSAFALQDGILLVYQGIVAGLAWGRGATEARMAACAMAALVLGCLAGRCEALPGGVRAATYRLTLFGALVVNYVMLRDLLPTLRPDSVDAALLAIDVAALGAPPALWLERYNHELAVEWFSFFYLSYFALCAGYMLAVLWLMRPGRHTTEFVIGSIIVYCVGQLGYIAVPAYGPVRHLAPEFAGPVQGGLFWGWIQATVASYGALKDVFPSVHTAASAWFAIFAWRQASRDRRWTWPARATAFAAANIVISTLFLRWHYAVDVVAGLALAALADALSRRLSRLEEERRARAGGGLPGARCVEVPEAARGR